jgi:fucose permease
MRAWLLAILIGAAGVDALLVYEVPAMVRADLTIGTAAIVAGLRGIAPLAERLPLAQMLKLLGARNTLVPAYYNGGIAALLLLASGKLALALIFSLLGGASIGALTSLQGNYTYELVDRRHLGSLLGAQQAFFGLGGAFGPGLGEALLQTRHSYTPTILMITIVFTSTAGVLTVAVDHERKTSHAAAVRSSE